MLTSRLKGPFAFGARAIDLPIAFFLGLIVGLLQLQLSTRTDLYSNLFEILAVLITSILSRVFGSLQNNELFCFPALAQSSIALILPGYTVLCGALELQAKSIIAGSVRLVYAIIYSLFLGFALTLGIAIVGVAWPDASSQTVCSTPLSDNGRVVWLFVPLFTLALCIINQAKWKQMPVMLFIAFVGYVVNYVTAARFSGNPQVSSAIGSFAIAILANIYSRVSFDRLVAKADREFRKLMQTPSTTTPTISTEPATPSTLESSSQVSGWRLMLYRVLHLGKLPPGHAGSNVSEKESKSEQKSRVQVSYSLAASAMLPAIFVQVPSGLSVSGSLVQGIAQGNQLASNSTGSTLTAGDVYSGRGSANDVTSTIAFTVGYSVVQVAIGITVGLFLGALIVYPFGKGGKGKRTRGTIFAF